MVADSAGCCPASFSGADCLFLWLGASAVHVSVPVSFAHHAIFARHIRVLP